MIATDILMVNKHVCNEYYFVTLTCLYSLMLLKMFTEDESEKLLYRVHTGLRKLRNQ